MRSNRVDSYWAHTVNHIPDPAARKEISTDGGTHKGTVLRELGYARVSTTHLAGPPPRPRCPHRLDLLPRPRWHPVFVNAVTIATATLLRDLADSHNMTIPRPALPKRWAQQFSGTITPHHYSNLQSSDYPTNHQSAHHLDQTQHNPAQRSPHHHH